jgi:uncharacterized heparinase superfamily protein
VDISLRAGYAHWRRLGVRRGTAAALRLVAAELRGPLRRTRLLIRPLGVQRGELAAALGLNGARAVLRGPVLAALPTVAAFERRLDDLPDDGRAQLLERAERIAAHSFDLLGSGPTALGPRIDWSCDFKTGRRWPRAHISQVTISYPDHSDIKVPWELSRFQHLPTLAAAHRLTGDQRWLDEIGAQLDDWIASNPVEFGANWACTMDVAIRAANWVATLALVAEAAADEPWFERTLESVLLHGRFIRTHLEGGPVRGNHYLSDVVGLLCVAAVFSEGSEGRAWARWASGEVVAELQHQVRRDGCDHEASIPYHRLVTELFICGLQAARALEPGIVSDADREVVERMLAFVRDYTRPDGLAPQVGDADDGRFLPLGDYGHSDPRSHLHLFEQWAAEYVPATRHAAYPESGYWIGRLGKLYAIVRCGDVGLGGQGCHAHNDALAFELSLGPQPLVIDPGSYLYTADPTERNRFRSTAFHSTLQLDGAEQNPLSDALFSMEDRRQAEALTWQATPDGAVFSGRHHGYESLAAPATHTRRIELRRDDTLVVTDTVRSSGEHDAQWTFPLAPCQVTIDTNRALARFDSGTELEVTAAGVDFEVTDGWYSPSYGRRAPTPFLRARRRTRPGEDVAEIVLQARTSPKT